MLYLKTKNIRIRKSFLKNEKRLKIDKFIFTFLLNSPYKQKKQVVYSFLKYKKLNKSRARINNRCVYNNTSKSVIRRFKISRNYLRNALSFGLIPGYKKAV
jgi:ribosomal protein S14